MNDLQFAGRYQCLPIRRFGRLMRECKICVQSIHEALLTHKITLDIIYIQFICNETVVLLHVIMSFTPYSDGDISGVQRSG
jgi:hypothetical protein